MPPEITKPLDLIKFDEADPPPPPPPDKSKKPTTPPSPPLPRLDSTVQLTMGLLSYVSKNQRHTLRFQFNPTDLERSRTVKVNRTPTGNTLEENTGTQRNQPKRKASRKPEPWDMTLSLRFDAGYYARRADEPALDSPYSHKVTSIRDAIRFFEALVDPAHHDHENENKSNAQETPPPPHVDMQFGKRQWTCVVKTLRIKELDYTPDLFPRRFEATLTLEVIETVRQNDMDKPGADT